MLVGHRQLVFDLTEVALVVQVVGVHTDKVLADGACLLIAQSLGRLAGREVEIAEVVIDRGQVALHLGHIGVRAVEPIQDFSGLLEGSQRLRPADQLHPADVGVVGGQVVLILSDGGIGEVPRVDGPGR